MQGFFLITALLYLSVACLVVKGQDDPCRGVVCPRGRMCVPHTNDEGKSYSTCECPTSCTSEVNEPVCSYYNTSFISRCEMHKFACAHDLTMKVKNEGSCPSDTVVACSEDYLLQFPTRYLEWIMIAREVSLDPTFSLSSGARADALTEAERSTILSWEFDYIDKNKNNVLDNEEVGRIFFDLLNAEPCIEGFLLSCDQNEKEGIERREWDSCFPKTAGTAFENKK
ncbi:hypothetical protein ABFA07_003418 [Porites harrisoni]